MCLEMNEEISVTTSPFMILLLPDDLKKSKTKNLTTWLYHFFSNQNLILEVAGVGLVCSHVTWTAKKGLAHGPNLG